MFVASSPPLSLVLPLPLLAPRALEPSALAPLQLVSSPLLLPLLPSLRRARNVLLRWVWAIPVLKLWPSSNSSKPRLPSNKLWPNNNSKPACSLNRRRKPLPPRHLAPLVLALEPLQAMLA